MLVHAKHSWPSAIEACLCWYFAIRLGRRNALPRTTRPYPRLALSYCPFSCTCIQPNLARLFTSLVVQSTSWTTSCRHTQRPKMLGECACLASMHLDTSPSHACSILELVLSLSTSFCSLQLVHTHADDSLRQ
jgi:hypothetical protein